MPITRQIAAMLSILVVASHCAQTALAKPSLDDKIAMLNEDRAVVLTTPASRLMMLISKKQAALVPTKQASGSDSPSYFYLADENQNIIASGWFEPASKFTAAKQVWEGDTKAWKKGGLPNPTNVSFQHIGHWDAVLYDVPVPGGINTHIRAHWVQAGSWIDLHLSMTSSRPPQECRAVLMALIKDVRVEEKKN